MVFRSLLEMRQTNKDGLFTQQQLVTSEGALSLKTGLLEISLQCMCKRRAKIVFDGFIYNASARVQEQHVPNSPSAALTSC